jgi:hypothetical protein
LISESLARRRRVLGDDHPYTIWSMSDHAVVLVELGRLQDAEAVAREAISKAAVNPSLGPSHPLTKSCATNHARCLDKLGRKDDAEAVRREFGLHEPTTQPATQPASKP